MKSIEDYKRELRQTSSMSLEEIAQEHTGRKKIKKFFKIATPILIIEVILALALGVYLLILPKNYCKINVNHKDAIIYVNNKETNKFRFNDPKEETTFYYYEVNVDIKLPAGKDYLVSFVVESEDYEVFVSTNAEEKQKTYSLSVHGGIKTRLFSAITIKSDTLIKDFDVVVNINVQN